jgi:hypothetical protein
MLKRARCPIKQDAPQGRRERDDVNVEGSRYLGVVTVYGFLNKGNMDVCAESQLPKFESTHRFSHQGGFLATPGRTLPS